MFFDRFIDATFVFIGFSFTAVKIVSTSLFSRFLDVMYDVGDIRVYWVFIHHNKNRIGIVVFTVSWFWTLCMMSHVLGFLTIHGLNAHRGWILATGACLYKTQSVIGE